MRTVVIGRVIRGQRGRTASGAGSMEFSELLDDVAPEPVSAEAAADLDAGLADLVMFPVPHRADRLPDPVFEVVARVVEPVEAPVPEPVDTSALEPVDTLALEVAVCVAEPVEDIPDQHEGAAVAELPKVSRFAETGLDDNLLPVRAPRRRRLQR